jgi:N-acetylglucosaminyl-diphospho-decaprenol L-rhamnosyltransferase
MGTSIVVPVLNQVHYTKLCVESLLPTVSAEDEIIIIDNGSSDGTPEYLREHPRLRIISNRDNLGCAKAWNQGLDAAGFEWVVIANNDVIFSSQWLQGLLAFAREEELDIVSPAIREGDYNYDIETYSKEFVSRMGSVFRRGVAQGSCFMISRKVVDSIGMFDENFRIGQFEDADFFRRAISAGFRLGTTGGSFVHHFGSVTQNAIRKNKALSSYELYNRAYYREKYGLTVAKRIIERRRNKLLSLWWRFSEKTLYGHTLLEKNINGRLRYF